MANPNLSIPPRVRSFNKCIDPADLQIGDIILSSPIAPGFFSKKVTGAIRYVQADLPAEHSEWTHAGIYLGDFKVLEAVPFRGVTVSPIWDRVGAYRLRFLRPAALSDAQRLSFLAESAARLGSRYGFSHTISLLFVRLFGDGQAVATRSAGPICSSVIGDAYLIAGKTPLAPLGKPARPGDLSMSAMLSALPVRWKSIVA